MSSSSKKPAAKVKIHNGSGNGDVSNVEATPVWLAGINENWVYGASAVRLPKVDFRQPRQKWTSSIATSAEERTNPSKGSQTADVPSPVSPPKGNLSFSDTPTKSVVDNKAFIINSTPRQSINTNNSPSPIHSPPNSHSHFHPPFHLDFFSTSSALHPDRNPDRSSSLCGARSKGDIRNAAMREERMREKAEMEPRRKSALPVLANGSGHLDTERISMSSPRPTELLLPAKPNVRMGSPSPSHVGRGSMPRISQPYARSRADHSQLRKPAGSQELDRATLNAAAPHHLAQGRAVRHATWDLLNQELRQHGPAMRREDDWSTWFELGVRVHGLTPNVSTVDLWKSFHREGSITTIKIFEDSKGSREGKASIRFSPPPVKIFWHVQKYPITLEGLGTIFVRLELEPPRRMYSIPTSVNSQNNKYPEVMALKAGLIDFGFMYDQKTMMGMYRVQSAPQADIYFRLNMRHQEVTVEFNIKIQDPRPIESSKNVSLHGKYNRNETLRFHVPFSLLQMIQRVKDDEDKVALLISLETPPRFFRKGNEVNTHEEGGTYWNQNDAWYRQTDIIYNPNILKASPLTLKKTVPIIDIGRWTTYRFVFDMKNNEQRRFSLISNAFRDHNVEIREFATFTHATKREPAVWEYIDRPLIRKKPISHALDELMIENHAPALTFPVRYQLEVCISQGCLNEHNMSNEFVGKLIEMDEIKAQDILEYVATQKSRIYDPMDIFDIKVINGLASRPQIPHYCAYIRSATITPTTVYYNTPTVETSNRIIRRYSEHADRFLRVRFTDEKFEGKIQPTDKNTMNEVFTRVKRAMINGLMIGDRHYEFLAFGNSQFREHGAYFIAPLPHFSAQRIRDWMGMFKDIKGVALYASRLGQCFSTTRAISGSKVEIKQSTDVKVGKYCFTDGVGKISAFLAQLAASELGIDQSMTGAPSVYQFRLGGCKGVLAVSPDAKMREIHIRPSQYKFPTNHEGLEIIRWSQFAASTLNRQLILILSSLGVPDSTFIQKLKMQLSNLERAMKEEKVALALLQKDIDANQMTLTIAAIILDGFFANKEPFLTSLLRLWRAWSIKYLKEKARILVNDGALLLGCTDETGQLKGYQTASPGSDMRDDKEASLPEIFVQLSKGPHDKPQVVKGPMLLARNPSLHPGDIRVVCGVDIPQLRHLKDVVVFPQTGDRDIPSMCSGGDLDGDDFLVMWDRDLLAHDWNQEPMDFSPLERVAINREITMNDITSFFVTYMKNDTLPSIAHAHVAQADFADDGVKDEKCLRLASLHSVAVDFVKTGQPARMPRELKPKKWPHFMEKKHKTKDQIYHSKKILGILYDQVERVNFVPAFEAPFDERILQAFDLDKQMLDDAASLKSEYDEAMLRVMAQHQIETEYEIWSTLVLHHAREKGDYKFHEVVGEVSNTLKARFRKACYDKAGGKAFEQIGPFVAAMYTVTADQISRALRECREVKVVAGQEEPVRKMVSSDMPLMSFPWLFHSILGKIASGSTSWLLKDELITKTASQDTRKSTVKKSHTSSGLSETIGDLVTATGVTHRGDVLELFDDLIEYEKEPQPVVPEMPSDADSSDHNNSASVDDILFGSSLEENLKNVSLGRDLQDSSEFKSDISSGISNGAGALSPRQVRREPTLVKPDSSIQGKVQEDQTSSQSDFEEEIVHLGPGKTILDYLAEYSDGSTTP